MAKKRRTRTATTTHRKKHKYPKKPKKPKASAAPKVWFNFEERMKLWEGKCRKIDADHKHKENIQRKYC
jgi:hypothetical protein